MSMSSELLFVISLREKRVRERCMTRGVKGSEHMRVDRLLRQIKNLTISTSTRYDYNSSLDKKHPRF